MNASDIATVLAVVPVAGVLWTLGCGAGAWAVSAVNQWRNRKWIAEQRASMEAFIATHGAAGGSVGVLNTQRGIGGMQ